MNPTDPTGATDPTTEADLETKLRRTFQAVGRASLGAGSAEVAAVPRSPLRSVNGGRRRLRVATLSAVAAVVAFVALFIAYGPQSGSPARKTAPAGQSPTSPPDTTVNPTNRVTTALPVVKCPTNFAVTAPPAATPVPSTLVMRVPVDLTSALAVYTDPSEIEMVLAPKGWNCQAFYGADLSGSINVYPSGQPAPNPTSEVTIRPRSTDEAITMSETGGSPVIAASTACPYFAGAAAQTRQYGVRHCTPWVKSVIERISQDAVGLAIPPGQTAYGIPSGGRDTTNVVVLYTSMKQPGTYEGSCTLPQSEHAVCTAVLNDIVTRYSGTSGTALKLSHHSASAKVLFTHVSPDGSRVVAKTTTCASTSKGYLNCGKPRHGLPAIEFDVTRSGHHFQDAVLDSYRSGACGQGGIMNPMYTSQVGSFDSHLAGGLIVICVHPPAVRVILPRTNSSGPSPKGDQMTPVDGLVAFPINNSHSLDRPQAFDRSGKEIGTSLPFPCC